MKIKRLRRRRSIKEKLHALFSFFQKKPQKRNWNFRSPKPKKSKKKFFKWMAFLGILFFWIIFLYAYYVLPDVKNSNQLNFVEATIIYDREALEKINNNPQADLTENILYVIHEDEKRDFVPLEEISPWLRQATVAIEDERFYRHFGFDIQGLLNAVLGQLGLRQERGGSTITQQLVKNTFLTSERSFKRKFNEILLAIRVELNYSKEEILELYLNKIDYGSNSQGVEVASQTFFGKSARELSLAESSILASIPKAPTKYSPYGSNLNELMGYNFDDKETGQLIYKKGRKDLVLENLLQQEKINEKQFSQAFAEAQLLKFKRSKGNIKSPHFVFLVRQKLEEKYGKDFLAQGGLRIFTTLDSKLQDLAETTIAEKSKNYAQNQKANNVALVSFNNETGEILSYVGGKDFFDKENDGQVDVLTSLRQPGSSFKPFVYAAGFEKGFSPSTVLFDVETDFGNGYKPQNFNGNFLGPVAVRSALNASLNIPAVKMAYLAGVENIFSLAQKLGLNIQGDSKKHGLSLALGAAEVEPLRHISAYQGFANGGAYYEPTAILEIRDSKGKVLETTDFEIKKKEGLAPEIAQLVRAILTDQTTRPTTDGFDWNQLLQLDKYDNGAKTGTSNRMVKNPNFDAEKPEEETDNPRLVRAPSDAWTIGFTPHLTAGVWVGNNRGQAMALGATGMKMAAPIWKKFMDEAHSILVKDQRIDPDKKYIQTENLVSQKVNFLNGKIATETTPEPLIRSEIFIEEKVPTQKDDSVQNISFESILTNFDLESQERLKLEIQKALNMPDPENLEPQNPETAEPPESENSELKNPLEGRFKMRLMSIRPEKSSWQNPVDTWLAENPHFLDRFGGITDTQYNQILEIIEKFEIEEKEKKLQEALLTREPIFFDPKTIRTALPPQLKIIYPKNNAQIATGKVSVSASVVAQVGIKNVRFYFDGKLMQNLRRAPFMGKFEIPKTLKNKSRHKIKVIAEDKAGKTTTQEISVTIGADGEGPEILFLGPTGNQKIIQNSQVEILAQVSDHMSSVASVSFYLDGNLLSQTTQAPYRSNFVASGNLGRHEIQIQATDEEGNQSQKSIPVIFTRESLQRSKIPFISKVQSYRSSLSVDVFFPHPENIVSAQLVISQGGKNLFESKWSDIVKYRKIQIPLSIGRGNANLQLIYQEKGRLETKKSSLKSVRL